MAALDGKTILITGATSGIGLESAVALARMGARTVLVGRDPGRTASSVVEVKRRSGSEKVESLLADFASLDEVRRLAADALARHDRIDVLVNNAGAVFKARTLTKDGIESTWAVNHLAPFLLTNLLLERLKASGPARIVNVASRASYRGSMDLDDPEYRRGGYSILGAYARSKLANVLFSNELARRLTGSGVTSNSLHPGVVATNIWSGAPSFARPVLALYARLAMITPEEGAKTMVHLAASPEVEGRTGLYWDESRPKRAAKLALDEALARRLWEVSAAQVGHVG
jgi:NAD(P)-dependent dehydrogenase (short-subunit alcohol dehydrogenase family)